MLLKNRLKINDKIKIILIYLGVFIFFYAIYWFFMEIFPQIYYIGFPRCIHSDSVVIYEKWRWLKSLIGFFIHYLPTFLFLKYVFKKVTDIKKRKWYIVFSIPLTILLYVIINLLIEKWLPHKYYGLTWLYYNTIGSTGYYFGVLLICFLPSVLITTWLLPKKYLPQKGEIYKTTLITILVSILPFLLFAVVVLIMTIISYFIKGM